jgi:hypothetical protein
VTSIEEGRAEHEQGYFFRMPDWLADALCTHRASGAAWALVTLVGRTTRWGTHTPQRITLAEMLEHTGYARQTISDALTVLVSWGVLYEEREADRRYVRYALVDLTTCSSPYTDAQGTARIDLLEHHAYSLPETSLKSRLVATSRYRSKKQTDSRPASGNNQSKNKTDISLKTDKNRSKKQTDISLKSRLVASAQPAPEAMRAAPLDYVKIKDKEEEHTQRPPVCTHVQKKQAAAPSSSSEPRTEPPGAGASADEAALTLLSEGACLLHELRKSPGWVETDGEAASKLDTLLRAKAYPLDWLVDEAIAYSSYRTKTGSHSFAGFLQWCNPVQNPVAGKHLAAYRERHLATAARAPSVASVYRSPSFRQHASQTEADRAALAAARASRAAYLAEPHEKPDYLR